MPQTIDMMGRSVSIPEIPSRILSLVPSQTELLCDLGLADRLVGVTKFCIHPTGIRKKAGIVGGTKQIRWERVLAMAPDLVIGNKEENEKEMIERLSQDYPVWMSDIGNLEEALEMIRAVGMITGKRPEADTMASRIGRAFEGLSAASIHPKPRTLYLIWKDPWMGVGAETFIHDMIERAGFTNCLSEMVRYPELSENSMRDLHPELVLLSSEPYPFRSRHLDELTSLLPGAAIRLVDGEIFSWYGSRLLLAPAYFAELHSKLRHTIT